MREKPREQNPVNPRPSRWRIPECPAAGVDLPIDDGENGKVLAGPERVLTSGERDRRPTFPSANGTSGCSLRKLFHFREALRSCCRWHVSRTRERGMLILSPKNVLGLGALGLAGLVWCGLAQAQALRCVDAQGNVSYRDAGTATERCTPINLQSMRDPRGESRDAAEGQIAATGREQECTGSLRSALFAPAAARFTLRPSGPSVLVGYV